MGQYYYPIILDTKQDEQQNEIILDHFYSHDYDNGFKLMEHSYVGNDFVNAVLYSLATIHKGKRLVWAGDYADNEPNFKVNLHILTDYKRDKKEKGIIIYDAPSYKYVMNHTTKEFIDVEKASYASDGYQIHPIPILTSEGNGRGGGDYWGNEDYIGIWARHIIEPTNEIPENYTEVFYYFEEK